MAILSVPGRGKAVRLQLGRMHGVVLGVAVLAYIVLFSARTIAAYQSGGSLFDLAVYEQGFWNALGDPPFYYSLEGEMSRFGRHFSPVFYVILPFYLIYSDPSTLLVFQSAAIGLGALPLYGFATARLGRNTGLALALCYLLNPAVHDVNLKNDFHEISFAMPALMLLIFLATGASTPVYLASLLLALSTREEIAVTTALFGLYLVLIGRQATRGLITLGISVVWFLLVFGVVMPGFNASGRFPLPEGYEYLGATLPEIVRTVILRPDLLLVEITSAPKLDYLFWIFAPIAFLPLLAPEVLLVAGIALTQVLASTYPNHFEIFERYAAPIVPIIFFATVVGVQRLTRLRPRIGSISTLAILTILIVLATLLSQLVLRKLPLDIRFTPEPRVAAALRVAHAIPPEVSVSAADHRWLPHLAHRRHLYVLSSSSPTTDIVMFDRVRAPVTNVQPAELRSVEDRLLASEQYRVHQCDEGLYLLARRGIPYPEALTRLAPTPPRENEDRFDGGIRLAELRADVVASSTMAIDVALTWVATERVTANYHVFAHLVDVGGSLIGQHDGVPGRAFCPTTVWDDGLVVRDTYRITLPADTRPGPYEVRVGQYDPETMKRISRLDANGNPAGDYAGLSVILPP
jgi:uncharacterized membrane protein